WAQYPDTMNTTANLTQGGYYTLYVRYATGMSYGMAWIDYNRNGTFESSEYIAVNTSLAFFGTASFIVPVTASLGKTGLRIRNGSLYSPYSGYACSNFTTSSGAGETEDYVVNIIPQPSHDLGAVAVVAPASGSVFCANKVDTVTAKVYNYGSSAESNFYVYATYTDSDGASHTIYTKYTASLAAATSDNVYIGTINPPYGGKYKLKIYTVLASDTIVFNDTSYASFTLTTLPILPSVMSDTVCPGASVAVVGVHNMPNIKFQWYSSATDPAPFTTDTAITISYPTADSFLYVAAVDKSGCISNRVPVSVSIHNPPVVDLGPDLTMCESPTFTLDAGNPGGKYLWSTGDTTRTIHVRTSGTYSVSVFRYCTSSDTAVMTINPLPKATGIDYTRSGSTYLFSVAGGQYINSYLWLFGDGDTSTLAGPLHTYKTGNVPNVKVVLYNNCGNDTVTWALPTGISSFNQQDNTIKIYPNPASQLVTISSANNAVELKNIEILNSVGQVIYSQAANSNSDFTVNVAGFTAGHYILRAATSKGYINRIIQVIH
ncbi:MAG: T9SS type A sorting domain-containing protein, partial [Bacteroidetes bacterium]|nr:T9SS type A sorting domain-containing protein [Bacteroidota bacterium]